jgi:hypothetical protein
MHDTLEALPPLDALPQLEALDLPDGLPPLESAESSLFADAVFDTLLASAVAAKPDSAEDAAKIAAHVRSSIEKGEVDIAMQQVMALGAAACMHPHLEDLANDLGEEVLGMTQGQGHEHSHDEQAGPRNDKKNKRRQRASISLAELLIKYSFLPKSTGQK